VRCPSCQSESPDTKKFCSNCGSKLSPSCPQCNAEVLIDDSFCGECGHPLKGSGVASRGTLSYEEKIRKIKKYLPQGITQKIFSQREKIEGERKQITVMFCDMKGFTALSDQLSPEEVYEIMDQVYEILIQKVQDYDGTVNEMTGDGIMALFGAPIALEDAPQRAIRSATAIHRELTKFNNRVRLKKGDIPPIMMRIGINTGPVVVGSLGSDLRVEFKAVGQTVNIASRMENLAEPGSTYISENTFKLTEGLFRVEFLGERKIKGAENPVRVYQVIASSSRRTRFDVSAERGLTPFVGRERELELLLDGFERARDCNGQAISIIGEAGTGKSRLLYEFRKRINNEDITFLEGRCLSYSRNEAYHLIADVLKSNFDIRDVDSEGEIRTKVADGLKVLHVDEAATLPYLLELLRVKESGLEKISMGPEGKKERTVEALKRIILKGSEIKPLVIATEDLYWLDKSSEEVLKELVEIIPRARIFLISTYRPGFVQTWGNKSYHSQVTLNRLSNRESLAMISHILGGQDIDTALEELILQKTEGVPFFIEEFIKSLQDMNIIEEKEHSWQLVKNFEKLAVPSTIQDVIMTRVDHLPEEAKDVIRAGSVIEREFSYDLIKKLTGFPERDILTHLSVLKDAELLYERGIFPNSSYIFKHSLTREVVYDSILTRKKKHLHEKIINTIEDEYKDEICYHYWTLARHSIACDNHEKGADYSYLEAKRCQKLALFRDAIAYAKMSVNCLEKLPQTKANQEKLINARTILAIYNLGLNYMVEAKEAVEPIVDLAEKIKCQKSLPGIYISMGTHCFGVEENFPKGIRYMNRAIEIAEDTGDLLSLWMAYSQLGIFMPHICEFRKALEYSSKCLDLSELARNPMGIALSKAYLTYSHVLRGEISPACTQCEGILDRIAESGDPYVKGTVYTHYGSALYCRGDLEMAGTYLQEGLTFCNKTFQVGWESIAMARLGFMSFDQGSYSTALDYHQRAARLLDSTRLHPSWGKVQKVSMARARVRLHDRDINLGEIFDHYVSNKMKPYKGFIARSIADIMLHLDEDHLSNAETWIKKALDTDNRNGTRWQLAKDHALYAEWFKKKGDNKRAKEKLVKAVDYFKECGADGWVTRAEKSLAELQ